MVLTVQRFSEMKEANIVAWTYMQSQGAPPRKDKKEKQEGALCEKRGTEPTGIMQCVACILQDSSTLLRFTAQG